MVDGSRHVVRISTNMKCQVNKYHKFDKHVIKNCCFLFIYNAFNKNINGENFEMKIKKPEQYSHKNKTDKINCALIDCIRVLN